jgi:hypothetical protein
VLVGGEGDIARPTAFGGTLKVRAMGSTLDLPVISVDGTVYARIPFTPGFSEVDPAAFGLAIAPVTTVLLAVTGSEVHGGAGALAVVARTVGMLVGLSLLTAVALRRFTAEVEAIGTPFELCPSTPADCAAYDAATSAAVLTQLHTVFGGAAIAAGLAAVAALTLLRSARPPAVPGG